MGKFLAIIGGLIAMVGGISSSCRGSGGIYFKWLVGGMIPPVLFFGGLIALDRRASAASRTRRGPRSSRKRPSRKKPDLLGLP